MVVAERTPPATDMMDDPRDTPPAADDGERPRREPPRLKQDRSIETRQRLIDAATELLMECGYAGFTTPAVAERARVSRGALQYHFASKDDIFIAVRANLAAKLNFEGIEEAIAPLPARERIERLVRHHWETIGSDAYVAALEVRLFERFNAVTHRSMMAEMDRLTPLRDAAWLRLFADTGTAAETLLDYRRYMMDMLRGVALRRIEDNRPEALSRQIDLLIVHMTAGIVRSDDGGSVAAQ